MFTGNTHAFLAICMMVILCTAVIDSDAADLVVLRAGESSSERLDGDNAGEPSLEKVYESAEKYIVAYCRKQNLDPNKEAVRWHAKWRENVDQAISDKSASSEQSYINSLVLANRANFNMNAPPERIVEACRVLLRYRDGRLEWLRVMKEALTSDNMRKTIHFLSQNAK